MTATNKTRTFSKTNHNQNHNYWQMEPPLARTLTNQKFQQFQQHFFKYLQQSPHTEYFQRWIISTKTPEIMKILQYLNNTPINWKFPTPMQLQYFLQHFLNNNSNLSQLKLLETFITNTTTTTITTTTPMKLQQQAIARGIVCAEAQGCG